MTSWGTDAGSRAAGAGAAAAEAGFRALGVVGGSGGSGREGCEAAGSCGSGVRDGGGTSMDRFDCRATAHVTQEPPRVEEMCPGWVPVAACEVPSQSSAPSFHDGAL